MSASSKINGSCNNCCVDVEGVVSILGDFGGQIEIDSEPVYNFEFDVQIDSGSIKKECQKAADEALINQYKDELINSIKGQAKQWVNDCLSASPAPCNQIVYTDPKTGSIIPNPAYKSYPSTLADFKEFEDTLCFSNCDGNCSAE
jgi:hypothetical protein